MSLKITAEIVCDACGSKIAEHQTKSTEWCGAYYRVKRKAQEAAWVIMQRGGPAKHFCPKCAETVPAKKFTAFTPEELLQRQTSRARTRHRKETHKKQMWWSEEDFQNDKWKYGL